MTSEKVKKDKKAVTTRRPRRDPSIAGQITTLAGLGLRLVDIGLVVGMSERTIRRNYDADVKKGVAVANAKIAQTLFSKAIEGDTTSLIFWCKTRLGWREKTDINLTSDDGSMTPAPTKVNVAVLSPEQLMELSRTVYPAIDVAPQDNDDAVDESTTASTPG